MPIEANQDGSANLGARQSDADFQEILNTQTEDGNFQILAQLLSGEMEALEKAAQSKTLRCAPLPITFPLSSHNAVRSGEFAQPAGKSNDN